MIRVLFLFSIKSTGFIQYWVLFLFRIMSTVFMQYKEYCFLCSVFFVKYKDPDCALAAIIAHHDKHQAKVGVFRASVPPPKESDILKIK